VCKRKVEERGREGGEEKIERENIMRKRRKGNIEKSRHNG